MVVKVYRERRPGMDNSSRGGVTIAAHFAHAIKEYPFSNWPFSVIEGLENRGPDALTGYASSRYHCESDPNYHLVKTLEV